MPPTKVPFRLLSTNLSFTTRQLAGTSPHDHITNTDTDNNDPTTLHKACSTCSTLPSDNGMGLSYRHQTQVCLAIGEAKDQNRSITS